MDQKKCGYLSPSNINFVKLDEEELMKVESFVTDLFKKKQKFCFADFLLYFNN